MGEQHQTKPLYLQADYIDTKIKQSMMWANGRPEHDKVYGECCCDFSCCFPELFEKDDTKRFRSHTKFMQTLLDRRDRSIAANQNIGADNET